MKPTNQGGIGNPFGHGANYNPAQLRDQQRLRSLMEQGTPPPPPNPHQFQPLGGDVVGESSALAAILRDRNIWGYCTPSTPSPSSLALHRPLKPISISSQHQSSASGSQSSSAALFPPQGGDVVGRTALYNTSLDPYDSSRLAAQPAASFGQWSSAAHWQRMQSSSASQRHPSPIGPRSGAAAAAASFERSDGDHASLGQYTSARLTVPLSNQPATSFNQWSSLTHWQPMPSSSTSQRHPSPIGPQPGAAIASFERDDGDQASLGQYISARLAAPLAPAVPTPKEVRRRLLISQPNPALVMDPEISKQAASLLDQGEAVVRVAVLSSVMSDVHKVMGSDGGAEVFIALLRAVVRESKWAFAELGGIVQAAASPSDRSLLMGVANDKPGETALKELFRVAAQDCRLCEPLFNCLVDGWIMDQHNGPELLRYLFTTLALPYHYCSFFIRRLAIPGFRDMVTSEFGWRCMVECLKNAREHELTDLEQTILNHTFEIAKSKFGSNFLQEVLKGDHGCYRLGLKDGIRERVNWKLVELSMDQFGSCVVHGCFISPPTELLGKPELPLLHHGLAAFLDLPNEQLSELVHSRYASCILRKLLDTGKDHSKVRTRAAMLARRIQTLQGLGLFRLDVMSEQVMRVVHEVLSTRAHLH